MTEKIEIEKPVVSKELAYAFEEVKGDCDIYPSEVCDIDSYNDDIPELENLNVNNFEALLIDMYVLGYEIYKLKKYVLKLPVVEDDGSHMYMTKDYGNYIFDCCIEELENGVTKSEIEADEGLKKLASVCELVEVED